MRMKKFCAMLAIALMLTGCSTAPEPEVNPSSAVSVESSEPSSTVSSEPVSSVASSAPASAPSSEIIVSSTPSDGNQKLLNNGMTDLTFLMGMDIAVASRFWDKDAVEIIVYEENPLTKCEVKLSDYVSLFVSKEDEVKSIHVKYVDGINRSSVTLLGLDGNDTLDSIAEKFGKENVYPYNSNIKYGLSDKLVEDVNKEMCSIMLHDITFYRADFDENGVMKSAHIAIEM